jgi:5-methylcytosine-specific restriction enzyme A
LREAKRQQEPCCEACLKVGWVEPATVFDHLVPISEGGEAFPPLNGLASLCARCHNTKTRVVDQLRRDFERRGCDIDGMPLDPDHPWNLELKRLKK